MDDWKIADLACLTTAQRQAFAKGMRLGSLFPPRSRAYRTNKHPPVSASILTVSHLLVKRVPEVAKKCEMPVNEMEHLIDLVCQELHRSPRTIRAVDRIGEEIFTTGERYLDETLGGGIRTGMVWEIAGEKCVRPPLVLLESDPLLLGLIAGTRERPNWPYNSPSQSSSLLKRGVCMAQHTTSLPATSPRSWNVSSK